MPGSSSGSSTWMKSRNVPAPKTRAAASMRGSICSMKGIMTRMTKGTVGTRLARMTPADRAAEPDLVEHGRQRNAVGDRRHQQRQQEEQHHELLARESRGAPARRRRARRAGPTSTTTANTTSKVTDRTSPSWNSLQARAYQRVVPAVGQPGAEPARRERVDDDRRDDARARLRTKKPTTAQTAAAPEPFGERAVVSGCVHRLIPSPPATGPR